MGRVESSLSNLLASRLRKRRRERERETLKDYKGLEAMGRQGFRVRTCCGSSAYRVLRK